MGRPHNQEGELRDKWVHIRYSQKEYALLTNLYHKTHYPSLSAYVRVKSIDKLSISRSSTSSSKENGQIIKDILNIRKEINYIGNNINQITKQVNAQKFASKQELTALIIELNKVYKILEKLEDDCKNQNG